MTRTALVFCGGGASRLRLPTLHATLVVAADGGVSEAERLGFPVDLLVGDLDSAPSHAPERVEARGGRVERHPSDKDASDLELALEAAQREGATEVVVVGGDRGRLDHLLANSLLLASPRFAALRVDGVLGSARLSVIRNARELEGRPGELISLFAAGGPARGVRTRGLRWALEGEDLLPGSTRGLSNEFAARRATIELRSGAVLAIRPGADVP